MNIFFYCFFYYKIISNHYQDITDKRTADNKNESKSLETTVYRSNLYILHEIRNSHEYNRINE